MDSFFGNRMADIYIYIFTIKEIETILTEHFLINSLQEEITSASLFIIYL